MPFTVTRVRTIGLAAALGANVENNVWIVGEDAGLVIIDAAHDPAAIAAVVDHRRVHAIVCTHGETDHINAAVELSAIVTAPIYLAAADRPRWDAVHPDHPPYDDLRDGDVFRVAGELMYVLPTPGVTPGGTSLYLPGPGMVFCGDSLCSATAGSAAALLELPAATVAHHAHGEDTTIGAEADRLRAAAH